MKQNLERITIIAEGSRGDVQPYVAMGIALKDKGYKVRILTNANYVSMINSYGLEGAVLCESFLDVFEQNPLLKEGVQSGNTWVMVQSQMQFLKKNAPAIMKVIDEEFSGEYRPDLVVTAFVSMYYGWYGLLEYNIPTMVSSMLGVFYSPNWMVMGLPTLPWGLHYYFYYYLAVPAIHNMFQPLDDASKKHVLERFPVPNFRRFLLEKKVPISVLISKVWRDTLFPTLHEGIRFVGASMIDRLRQLDHPEFGGESAVAMLENFLSSSNEKPVYIGWGSLYVAPIDTVLLCIRAVRYAGQRAVILGGLARLEEAFEELVTNSTKGGSLLDPEELQYAKKNLLFVNKAPHDWLFDRVSCTVHHGGIGTTQSSLLAGIPTIVTPMFLDNFDNSKLVRDLGVGVGFEKHLTEISYTELGSAIQLVTADPSVQRKAREIGAIMQREDGANAGAVEIERYWDEYVVTGILNEVFPGEIRQPFVGPFFLVVGLAIFAWFCVRRARSNLLRTKKSV